MTNERRKSTAKAGMRTVSPFSGDLGREEYSAMTNITFLFYQNFCKHGVLFTVKISEENAPFSSFQPFPSTVSQKKRYNCYLFKSTVSNLHPFRKRKREKKTSISPIGRGLFSQIPPPPTQASTCVGVCNCKCVRQESGSRRMNPLSLTQ